MNHGITEQRIALVLNGGVSLAVWMAGVVYEIDLLRRASTAKFEPGDPDGAIMERWQELCKPAEGAERRVVVDVIAGTSAGGLNGTLLATAIARGTSLNATGDEQPWLSHVWVDQASLTVDTLLSEDPDPTALLSGKYFTDVIDNALNDLSTGDSGASVSLFVTATAMDPSQQSYTDGYGGEFTVPDHRRMYLFEKGNDRLRYDAPSDWADHDAGTYFVEVAVDDFAEGNAEALKLATRGSASFPVAFPAVQENEALNKAQQLPPRENGCRRWLVDGGILDNAPFGPVLDAIAARPLTGDTQRTLIYVVPSDGRRKPPAQIGPDGPNWREVALAGLSYPREVDFRADIEQLEVLLRECEAVWSDADQLFAKLLDDPQLRGQHTTAAENIVATYRRARAAGGIRELRLIADTRRETFDALSAPQSLSAHPALSSEDVEAILATTPTWLPSDSPLGEQGGPAPWQWGLSAAHNAVRLILQRLRDQLIDTPADSALTDAITVVDLSLRRVAAVRERMMTEIFAFERVVVQDNTTLAQAANEAFGRLFIPEVLGTLVQNAVSISAPLLVVDSDFDTAEPAAVLLRTVLAIEVINKALHARLPAQRHAAFNVLRLGPDTKAPVLGPAPGILSEALGGGKLYGTQAAHFGAFGRDNWRRWDWTWGRLDAVSHLGRVIGRDLGWPENEIENWIKKTQAAVLEREGRTVVGMRRRLERVANLNLPRILRVLRTDPEGQETLQLLADRAIGLVGTLEQPALATAGKWFKALVQRHNPPELTSTQKVLRWFAYPVRRSAWYWLTHSRVAEPATPWYCRWAVHISVLLILLFSCALSVWSSSNSLLTAVLGVLTGAMAVTLTLLAVTSRLRTYLSSRIPARS
jgi:patatin-related protein